MLDGEIVAFDEQGRPSFQRLQPRMHLDLARPPIRRRMADTPVVYMIFDVLYLDGPLDDGAALHASAASCSRSSSWTGPHWRTPAYHVGDGKAMLEASDEQGLEGVVAKRLDSRYEPGGRTRRWLKIKNHLRPGARDRRLAARQGRPQRHARLARGRLLRRTASCVYAGNVGTGFTRADARAT